MKPCPFCNKENSISSDKCSCGYFFNNDLYEKKQKQTMAAPVVKMEKVNKRDRNIQIFMMCLSALLVCLLVLGFCIGSFGLSRILMVPLWCMIFVNYYSAYKNTDVEDGST